MTQRAGAQSQTLKLSTVGHSLSLFLVISFLLCVASGFVFPDWKLHQPWLHFSPGFEWMTLRGTIIGLVESYLYGWYTAIVFVPLYNFFQRS